MKKFLLFALVFLSYSIARAQIGIGTPTPNLHSVLDLKSPGNNQGLLTPSMTAAQRTATAFVSSLGTSESGLLVFDTDDKRFYFWNGATWDPILHGTENSTVNSTPANVIAGGDLTGTYPNPTIATGKVTSTTLLDGSIINDDISAAAAIQDSKLATISAAGKVSGNAITTGTISGNTVINTTGTITTAGLIVTNASPTNTINAANTAAGGTAISGKTNSISGGFGVYGLASGTGTGKTATYSYGVSGKNLWSGSSGYLGGLYGAYGENATGTGIQGVGITGVAGNGGTSGNGTGVFGTASGSGSYGVYSNGSAGGTTTWSATSDRRYKKNIATIEDGLGKVLALRGVRFDWRNSEFPQKNFTTAPDIGVIAQEVKEVLPEVVMRDNAGFYSVSYEKIVPVLIEAIHQQQEQIVQLQKKMNELTAAKSTSVTSGRDSKTE